MLLRVTQSHMKGAEREQLPGEVAVLPVATCDSITRRCVRRLRSEEHPSRRQSDSWQIWTLNLGKQSP